jgi:hypothetical protein
MLFIHQILTVWEAMFNFTVLGTANDKNELFGFILPFYCNEGMNMCSELHIFLSAQKTVGSFLSIREKDSLDRHEPVRLLLKLVLQAVSYKDAVFVSDPVTVVQHVIELLKLEVAEDVLVVSSEIGAALLMSSILSLPQEYASRIVLKVRELFIEVCELVVNILEDL